jgi:hypothetical protein
MIKSQRMRHEGHVECMGEFRNAHKILHLGDPGIDGKIILRLIFRKRDVGIWTGLSCLRIGTGGRHL